ncbi:wax ester synthase-like acyl-CoA acyltransferase domain-containing protein [Thamnidium elegans]|uniref:Diacylglycerol O-acyltransferase n=1 Tax=Thamnidium elegans TaxID=101142 RepID=A0A8H7SXY2_9FUNG|nr:hypothetical protein INT48_003251 [Thamnidium elegans]KAI8080456.1 wax ester synthase-like acyl-CoA acyltransferase domain-containing protein [Thamnidium elegans]
MKLNTSDQYLDGIDTLFMKCEHPRRLMTVTSLWTFQHRLDAKQVYPILDRLCQSYPRFSRVPRRGSFFKAARWTVPVGWCPDQNVVLHTLCEPTKFALQDYCSKQVVSPFDYTKPLWELHAISGLEGDQCALFWKAHHALSDGQGFIRSLLSTTSLDASLKKLEQQGPPHHNKHKRNTIGLPKQIWGMFPNYITALILWVWYFVSQAHLLWITLYHDFYSMILCILPMCRKDFIYNELQSHEKEMAWSDDIRLQDINTVRKVFGGTLNDVMLAVVTRSVKNYLESVGDRHDNYVSFIIPVSLRKPNDWSCHNVVSGSWGFFSMKDLNTKDLIDQVQTEMMAVKTSFMVRFLYDLVQLVWGKVPALSPPLCVYDHICNISHGVFTNIPGPTKPISFAGQQILEYRAFPPQSGKGSIGIALVSYDGNVSIGAIADVHRKYPRLADNICARFANEFKFMLDEAKMESSKRET